MKIVHVGPGTSTFPMFLSPTRECPIIAQQHRFSPAGLKPVDRTAQIPQSFWILTNQAITQSRMFSSPKPNHIHKWRCTMKRSVPFLLCVVLLMSLFTSAVSFAQNPVCGAVLTANTTLVGDLDCSSYVGGPVLTIGADNITLDLAGFTLTANDAGYAVSIPGRSGITIKNGSIRGLSGIVLTGSNSNISIMDINASWTGVGRVGAGILLNSGASASGMTVQNVTANNREVGIELLTSSSNVTIENSVCDNSAYGLYLIGVNGLSVTNVSAQNGATGALLGSLAGTIAISNVNVTGTTGYGLRFVDQNGFPTIVPGMFTGFTSCGTAIELDGTNSNIHIGSNSAATLDLSWTGAGKVGAGILANYNSSVNGLTIQNVIANNRDVGMETVSPSSNVTIENSTFSGNSYGVYIDQITGLLFFHNRLFNNSVWSFLGNQGYNLWNPAINEGNFWGHTNPVEPCFFQFGGAFTPFDANRADILDLNCFYTPNTGTGTITGSVFVGSAGLASVIVKLLDGDGHTIPAFPAITTSNTGGYSFASVPSGEYQVMIVVPLDYTVDSNPKDMTLPSGGTATVNFRLTRAVRSNHAREAEYWKNQFDEHRCHGHHWEEREEDLYDYIAAIHEHYDPHFNIFHGLNTIDAWDDVLSVGRHATTLAKAKQELASLLMNLVSLKIGQYTKVTRDNRTAGDVLTYVSQLVIDGISSNDALARDLANKVNDQDMISAGIVPASNILYKGAGEKILWTFDIPTEYALSQNYPNPFNPSTTISYDIPSDGRASLKVYNYLGQEVALLVDQEQQAGRYQIRWDASGLASGVYFYRLRANGTDGKTTLMMKKMLLLK